MFEIVLLCYNRDNRVECRMNKAWLNLRGKSPTSHYLTWTILRVNELRFELSNPITNRSLHLVPAKMLHIVAVKDPPRVESKSLHQRAVRHFCCFMWPYWVYSFTANVFPSLLRTNTPYGVVRASQPEALLIHIHRQVYDTLKRVI